jgi:hypothetical protein
MWLHFCPCPCRKFHPVGVRHRIGRAGQRCRLRSIRRLPFPPSRTTIRSRLRRGVSTSMARHILTLTRASSGQIRLRRAAYLRPPPRSTGLPPVCPLGCKSSDLISKIARRLSSPSFLNGSSAASSPLCEQKRRLPTPSREICLEGSRPCTKPPGDRVSNRSHYDRLRSGAACVRSES